MSEHFSTVFVSGDVGQALAVREGVALIFDGVAVSEATTAEINMFFATAMELEEVRSEELRSMNSRSLSDLVVRATTRADALRFLLFGMDASLSDRLRLRSIKQASALLAERDIVRHIQERFLEIAGPGTWDVRSAAAFSIMVGADLPALLYFAASDRDMLAALKDLAPEQWPTVQARPLIQRHLTSDRQAAPRHIWELVAECLDAPLSARHAALSAAEWFVERFGGIEMAGVRAQVARALIHSAALHARTGSASSSLDKLEDAVARIGELRDDGLRTIAAMATVCRAALLAERERPAEAVEDCERALRMLAGRRDPLSGDWAATARFHLAHAYGALEQWPLAIEHYDRFMEGLRPDPSARVRLLAAKAIYNRAHAYLSLGRIEEARDRYNEVVRALRAARPDDLPIIRAKAEYNLAWLNARLGEVASAVRSYKAALASCAEGIPAPSTRAFRLRVLYNLGTVLAQAGDHREAISAYREVVEGIRKSDRPGLDILAAQAMFNLALSLEATAGYSEANTAYREVETFFASVRGAARIVLKARARRAALDVGPAGGAEAGQDHPGVEDAAMPFGLYDSSGDEL